MPIHPRLNARRAARMTFLCVTALAWTCAEAARLTVDVSGIAVARGNIIVRLYGGPDGFPRRPSKAVVSEIVPAQAGHMVIEIDAPRLTEVAVAVAHDLDGDRELDFNLLGIPTEPYGFSNNARSRLGPPAYDAAKIDLSRIGKVVEVRLSD